MEKEKRVCNRLKHCLDNIPCRECEHSYTKLTGPESWLKAKEGDTISGTYGSFIKGKTIDLVYSNRNPIGQFFFFSKDWTIIPKKKTVTVEIPEVAENVLVTYHNDQNCPHWYRNGGIKEITYEINGDD